MLKNYRNFQLYTKYTVIGLILLISFYDNYASCDTLKLESYLAECYRKENIKPLVPNTLQVLLEIIRKLENETNTAGDIKLLSAKLLHYVRVDGVQKDVNATESEFVIPYSPNSLFSQKYSILLKLISNVPGEFNVSEYLTPLEICTLHKILSSTVEPLIRGDEHLTCNKYDYPANRIVENNSDEVRVISFKTSRCPVEGGVIRTRQFGTISPGVLIASIAAGLEPQAVQFKEIVAYLTRSDKMKNNEDVIMIPINDRINNTFASNLAGDLAEVCLYQSPYYTKTVHVGTSGYWNNHQYPIVYYVNDSNYLNWFMTDNEIISGIDGYYLANNIKYWFDQMSLLRLSQVLELYYSKKGIPKLENSKRRSYSKNEEINSDTGLYFNTFDDADSESNSACRRKLILKSIERQKLKYETHLFAKVLQYTANTPLVDDSVLKKSCDLAVDKFFEKATKLIEHYGQCLSYSRALIDMTIILDGTRNQTENYKLISYISEIIDVSQIGSRFSVINGYGGNYMIKPTKSIVDGFKQFKIYDGEHPQGLSLTRSLSTIIFSLENSASEESSEIVGMPPVIVVFSQSQRIVDNDFEDAKKLIEGSFKYNQNIYFVFITNDGPRFEDLVSEERKNPLNSKDKFTIIETNDLNVNNVAVKLLRKIRTIPKWLRALSCEYSVYEDYIGTEYSNNYQINSYEIKQHQQMTVQFQVAESYGVIIVCKNVEDQPSECISSSKKNSSGEIWFKIDDICTDENNCPPVNFKVEFESTNNKCTETTCRHPDQIRYYIRIKRTECNSASLIKLSFNCYILLFISFIYIFKKNYFY